MNGHQRYLIEEFAEEYLENRLSRRDLLKRVLLITGSVAVTATVLTELGCSGGGDDGGATATAGVSPTGAATTTGAPTPPAAAGSGITVPPDDPAVRAEDVRFKGPASDILGYIARPREGSSFPGVLLIHENQGLQEHFKDVARRYAREGFAAIAVDLVSRQGGTSQDPNANPGTLGRANVADLVADLQAGIDYLKSQSFVKAGSLGVTGWCFGGGYTWEIAMASGDLKAAVPYYGSVARMEDLPKVRAAVLAVYGQNDTRITSQAAEVERRLREAGKTVEIKVYPGAGHAFFNDSRSGPYNAEASQDAWRQTLAWFRKYL